MIFQALELGTPYEWTLVLLIVNVSAMILSIFTDRGWMIYLAIPGYLIYNYGGLVKNWFFSRSQSASAEPEELSQEELKKQQKKEKKQQKIKYVRG